jgi:hypothetical protein
MISLYISKMTSANLVTKNTEMTTTPAKKPSTPEIPPKYLRRDDIYLVPQLDRRFVGTKIVNPAFIEYIKENPCQSKRLKVSAAVLRISKAFVPRGEREIPPVFLKRVETKDYTYDYKPFGGSKMRKTYQKQNKYVNEEFKKLFSDFLATSGSSFQGACSTFGISTFVGNKAKLPESSIM